MTLPAQVGKPIFHSALKPHNRSPPSFAPRSKSQSIDPRRGRNSWIQTCNNNIHLLFNSVLRRHREAFFRRRRCHWWRYWIAVVAPLFRRGIPHRVSPVPALGSDHARRVPELHAHDKRLVPEPSSVPDSLLFDRHRRRTAFSSRQQLSGGLPQDHLLVFGQSRCSHAHLARALPDAVRASLAAAGLHVERVPILRAARQPLGRGSPAYFVLRFRIVLPHQPALAAQPVRVLDIPCTLYLRFQLRISSLVSLVGINSHAAGSRHITRAR